MSFWQQLNQLLSEAPGNLVYHLITLFAIQATLAISLSQWRRARAIGRDDRFARRLTLGAAGLLLTRIILLAVSIVLSLEEDSSLPVRILPPLEQAMNTLNVVLIAWMLAPPIARLPRLTDVLVLIAFLVIGVMYIFFAQEWATIATPGITYNGTGQATFWGITQLVVLAITGIYLVARRLPSNGLRLLVVLALAIGHFLQFWNYPETVPSDSEIPFWVRMGQLVALPLLAILAYRHSLYQLIAARNVLRTAPEQIANSLQDAEHVMAAPTVDATISSAVAFVDEVLQAPLTALAVFSRQHPEHLDIVVIDHESEGEIRHWSLRADDWPAFRMASEQEQTVELLPDGLGARQLHDLYQEIGRPTGGSLLIAPLLADDDPLGFLLIGKSLQATEWDEAIPTLAPVLAAYTARALTNARMLEEARHETSAGYLPGDLHAIEIERNEGLAEIERLRMRLREAEDRAASAELQAGDLAVAMEAMRQHGGQQAQVEALQSEVAALRESLIEAEEALAMAAASENRLSTEWVTQALSRYSGELEQAQIRIAELEDSLRRQDPERRRDVLLLVAQELRTPLTSISGYTELVLSETAGELDEKQRDFIGRVRANVSRMAILLEQLIQLVSTPAVRLVDEDLNAVDLEDVLDAAVQTVIGQVRKKGLRLNLDIAEALPKVPADADVLRQVFIHLLSNASQASAVNGQMSIVAHSETFESEGDGNGEKTEQFVHVAVCDSGMGISPEDRGHVFDPQYRTDHPLIEGLGETGAGLAVAEALVQAHGGRIWVDSELGVGSTFSVLLPVWANGHKASGSG